MKMTDEPLRVLVVEDDADTRLNLCDILELDGFQIDTAGTAAEALNRENWESISAIILDRKLPDGTAQDLLPRIRKLAPDASVLIVTGYADLDGAISALRQGAEDYLLKPINPDLLRASLSRTAERIRSRREIARLNSHLQHRLTELQTVLDVVPVGIAIAHDCNCERISVNAALTTLLGVEPDANVSLNLAAGKEPWYRVMREGRELSPQELPLQVAALRGIEMHDVEFEVLRKDGQVIHFVGSAAPLLNDQGKTRGAVGAFLDVTERKRMEERRLQQGRLAAIGETMTGLVHESRNALQRSKACLEMLALEIEDRPEALDYLSRAQKAQEYLHQLYEEVREYAAPLRLHREACDLSAIWRETWADLSQLVSEKQLVLEEKIAGSGCICRVDRFVMNQVFRNILENAIAVSPPGGKIAIDCREATWQDKPVFKISISDQGPGLSAEQRRRIFEPFFTTKTKGTGLGMPIAQRIVQSHGGALELGDANRIGAEITILLPRDRPHESTAENFDCR